MSDDHSTKKRPDAQEIEVWLSALLAERLKVTEINPERPLSDYGLNSMMALRLLDKVEKWLGQSLPATLFFDYPDIRQLAQALASGTVTEAADPEAQDADCY